MILAPYSPKGYNLFNRICRKLSNVKRNLKKEKKSRIWGKCGMKFFVFRVGFDLIIPQLQEAVETQNIESNVLCACKL